MPTDSKPIWSVAWSPDGQRLAAGNTGVTGPLMGGTITVWQGPVPALLGQRARARTRALEALLLGRRVVTPVAFKPKPPAAVFKEGGVYGTVTRLEPPFGNLETSFVLSDLRAVGIVPASRFDMRCREKTFTLLLGEHWTDVSPGEWVAYLSVEGDVIIARNGANASELSGCQAGDSVFVTRGMTGTTLVLKQPDLARGSHQKPPTLPVVPDSVPPIARNAFQLPSGSFFNTASPVPRICFVSPPGESTYEAVKERHATAQPPSRNVKSLVSGT